MKPLILGTRGSDLALAQTDLLSASLHAALPGLPVERRIIRTTGDARLDVSLSAPGALDKGLFTKELEDALLAGVIDAAVHSLKDLPTEQPPGLAIGAILPREDPGDVLVARAPGGLDALPPGARVATSSLRRKRFLAWQRPDLEIVEIRGNVPTRLRKLRDGGDLAAIVLAAAGLRRLEAAGCPLPLEGLTRSPLPFMLPAPGQGAIAVQSRAADERVLEIVRRVHDDATATAVAAERAVLGGLGGGCHLPLGTLATIDAARTLTLRAIWFPDDQPRDAAATGAPENWRDVARVVTTRLAGSAAPQTANAPAPTRQ